MARRLLARDTALEQGGEPQVVGAALQRTCLRVSDNLRQSMGEDGSNALLARALARTEADHPALTTIRRVEDGSVHLDGVAASVEVHGVAAVTAAIEALLAALVDVLARLIGEDMAVRLIDRDGPQWRPGGGGQAR